MRKGQSTTSTETLHPHFGRSWAYGGDGDVVAELAKGSRQNPDALLPNLGIRFAALLNKSHSLVQDLTNHAVGNWLLTLISNCFTNINLSDMETCYKVFRREVIQAIPIEENRFGFEP
jgi:hypothetical protein